MTLYGSIMVMVKLLGPVSAKPAPKRKPPVDFSVFTRARWEAERRKAEAMLATDGDGVIKVYDKDWQ